MGAEEGTEEERRKRRLRLQQILNDQDATVDAPGNPIFRGARSPLSLTGSGPSRRPRGMQPVQHQRVRKDESQVIGSGAFGRVYKGLNEVTGQLVAVKEISFDKGGDELKEQLAMLAREIQIMKKLNHPNIVRYLGAHREGHTLQIFMEFVPGGSLASLVKKFGQLLEDTAKTYLTQMLCGLEYLHGQNVAHRDIKGDNVLLEVTGEVKLADFGTSKEVEDAMLMTKMSTVTGTPWFMAPEVIKGEGYGFEADVWSVGATAIELLTGKPPFSNFPRPQAVMFHIASSTAPPPFPTGIAPSTEEFLRLCLQPDPTQRGTVQELLTSDFCLSCNFYATEEEDAAGGLSPQSPASPATAEQTDVRGGPSGTLRQRRRKVNQMVPTVGGSTAAVSAPAQAADLQYLLELSKLRQQGIITELEFEAKKNQILWGAGGAPPASSLSALAPQRADS
eukprot:GGOE01057902.1.p1 GENE.GGOE01057902.1~~GGOE01057902.1.p1  ORF type:complete len:449 (-),score=131.26 GGOE01057902.1:166-1512(-)